MFDDALDDEPDAELGGAMRRRTGGSSREQPDRQARALCPDHRRAVTDVETLRLGAIRVDDDRAVGEDAVDVEEDQLDSSGLVLESQFRFRVPGSGFRVPGSRFGVLALRLEFRVCGSGFKIRPF